VRGDGACIEAKGLEQPDLLPLHRDQSHERGVQQKGGDGEKETWKKRGGDLGFVDL
jgi:hypothetical protein